MVVNDMGKVLKWNEKLALKVVCYSGETQKIHFLRALDQVQNAKSHKVKIIMFDFLSSDSL